MRGGRSYWLIATCFQLCVDWLNVSALRIAEESPERSEGLERKA
jgi:hypothetical protein